MASWWQVEQTRHSSNLNSVAIVASWWQVGGKLKGNLPRLKPANHAALSGISGKVAKQNNFFLESYISEYWRKTKMRGNPKSITQKMMFSETLKTVLRKPTNRHERRVMAKLKRR